MLCLLVTLRKDRDYKVMCCALSWQYSFVSLVMRNLAVILNKASDVISIRYIVSQWNCVLIQGCFPCDMVRIVVPWTTGCRTLYLIFSLVSLSTIAVQCFLVGVCFDTLPRHLVTLHRSLAGLSEWYTCCFTCSYRQIVSVSYSTLYPRMSSVSHSMPH
jgi:hypothetical protein